mmetsp:Transcript_14608/g.37494  ORF Transcript_14608/g.37494 Transcript_14608/m.37494 type:complete len:299 (-) Transcript_14608:1852-2748(-)
MMDQVMASRCSYLPAVAEQLLQHFQRVLPPGEHTPWFDHCGVPLKWHIPIGVLYDILHTERSTATPLPWELTVHYRSFPSQELITCDDVTTPRSAFVNSLKEAAFALTGSSSAIMNWLGRLEDTWRHVQDGNVAQCLSEMAAFNLHPSLHAERKTRIPMRVMITKLPPGARWSWEYAQTISCPVDVALQSGSDHSMPFTLAAGLRQVIPDLFPGPVAARDRESARPSDHDGAKTSADAADCAELAACARPCADCCFPPDMTVIVAGIQPPAAAPLLWLHTHLKHLDHFLYVVVHVSGR